ncbi:DDE-type integrase/transposase/recombinase [Lentibacter algarum]|nr:DDE-type integrase/transposase/recombinase [Lentibacter algarum]
MEETYIRVGGKWRYLWRTVDANGRYCQVEDTTYR